MQLWRISRYTSLDGRGGMVAAGRWHTRGRPITYCAPHPATVLIEWIVHLELAPDEIPATIPYIVIDVPDDVVSDRLDSSALPSNWRNALSITQELGDAWLASRRSALLQVPSAVIPETENVLINPLHPDSPRIRIERTVDEPFDARLLAGRSVP